jgi:hypothetical protein
MNESTSFLKITVKLNLNLKKRYFSLKKIVLPFFPTHATPLHMTIEKAIFFTPVVRLYSFGSSCFAEYDNFT